MTTSVLASLNTALHIAMASDERVWLLGEDLLDPYGGAFKVTRGLSTSFPGRVLTSPISEAGLVGVATGMALRGLRPVVEIMFGDFLTLAADQLVNHAAKFRWMYNDQVRAPLVVRTPMGGRRGYGPTHSQSLEKHFLGAPGLVVVAPAPFETPHGGPGDLLRSAILEDDDPVLFIENKLLYLLPVQTASSLSDLALTPCAPSGSLANAPTYPAYQVSVKGAPTATLTLAAYGYMAELACQAVLRLAYQHEIFAELIVPTRLSPSQLEPVLASTRKTGRLLVVEEGGISFGWSAEVMAQAQTNLGSRLVAAGRAAALDLPIPASGPLEAAVLPGVDDIVQAACLLKQNKG